MVGQDGVDGRAVGHAQRDDPALIAGALDLVPQGLAEDRAEARAPPRRGPLGDRLEFGRNARFESDVALAVAMSSSPLVAMTPSLRRTYGRMPERG